MGDSIKESELCQPVAQVFNSWHIKKCQVDGVGYGGKIPEKKVQQVLKDMGTSILKGTLGMQPTTISNGNFGLLKPAMGGKLIMTGSKIDVLSQKHLCETLKSLGLSQNGDKAVLHRRLKKHFRL